MKVSYAAMGMRIDDSAESARENRDRVADDRDTNAEAHDQQSKARDVAANARDRRAETREREARTYDREAVADRAEAWQDRNEGAGDRTHASHDRQAARLDRLDAASGREEAAAEHTFMSTDDLTGAFNRGPGYAELEREIARARRTKKPLAVAFVDVDGLKERNDAQGHAAGDQLLRETAASIRSHLRPYDLMIRYGGDEFVCVLFDMDSTQARDRFTLVNADLYEAQGASVSIGLAMLTDDDALEDLLQRADADMYRDRRRQAPGASH